MRRRDPRILNTADSLPLFPVLAVLLSTVGVLCLLLLVVTRQALLSDHRRDVARTLRLEIGRVRATLAQREQDREDIRQEITKLQKELTGVRGHIQELQRRLASAKDQLQDLYRHREGLVATLTYLRTELDKLKETQKPPADHPGWIVTLAPSPHGDTRTPVFLECHTDRVRLQPSGVDVFEQDFSPGRTGLSPFQVFLKELVHLLEQKGVARPYPVLIVRPEGIAAFYAAMQQLERVGLSFGYELVESEKRLLFPELEHISDDEIARLLQVARIRANELQLGGPASVPVAIGRGAPFAGPPGKNDGPGLALSVPRPTTSRNRDGAPQPTPGPAKSEQMSSEPGDHESPPTTTVHDRRPQLLALAPPHGGALYRDVYAVVSSDRATVLPALTTVALPLRNDSELNGLLKTLAALVAMDTRLLVLEVRPRVICFVTPDGVGAYWNLRFQLARAGARARFEPLNTGQAAMLEETVRMLGHPLLRLADRASSHADTAR